MIPSNLFTMRSRFPFLVILIAGAINPFKATVQGVEEGRSGEAALAETLTFFRSFPGLSIKYTLKREFPQNVSRGPVVEAVHLISAGDRFIARLTRIIDEKEKKLGDTEILAYDGTFYQDYTDHDRSLTVSRSPIPPLNRLLKSCPLTAPCYILIEEDQSNRFPLQLLTSLEFTTKLPKRIDISKVNTFEWESSEASYSINSEIFPVLTKYSENDTWRTVTVVSWFKVKVAGREMTIPEAILYEGHAKSGRVIVRESAHLTRDAVDFQFVPEANQFTIPSSEADSIYDNDIEEYVKAKGR